MRSSHWTVRDDEDGTEHIALLGKGGYGEVHKVKALSNLAY